MSRNCDRSTVVVVGSCNTDLISYVRRRPERGETVLGKKFLVGFGGKGANQAVAASRLGANTYMVAKVGNDSFGRDTIDNFAKNGVNTDYVYITDDASTGAAPITVEDTGENSIIVNSGANDMLAPSDVEKAADIIKSAAVLICQGEVPLATTLSALKLAKSHNVLTILNPAPANDGFSSEFYQYVDIICPNETECESLTGGISVDPGDPSSCDPALDWFLSAGCQQTVIITLGKHGAVYKLAAGQSEGCTSGSVHVRPLYSVDTVCDTTGAGDAFLGSLSYYLANYKGQLHFTDIIQRSNYIAGLSVQRPGTQTSFPHREQLPQKLFNVQQFM